MGELGLYRRYDVELRNGVKPAIPGQTLPPPEASRNPTVGPGPAKAAGPITSSSDEELEYVTEKYGVDYMVNYKTPNWGAKGLEAIAVGGAVLVVIGFPSQRVCRLRNSNRFSGTDGTGRALCVDLDIPVEKK
ncbi:hypothetical protein PISL3812_02493 [Talaromyces islandicus]|uniref:Uncharacterized protein n=1 Tax=Talaromyces islandicus TaxID=28573 RepID=A0A0U1LQE4_TALIS|nr:hypothetical protein PISL3812_02493 [Talaromyces islandicus]